MTKIEKQISFFGREINKSPARIEREQEVAQDLLEILDRHGKHSNRIPMMSGRLGNHYREFAGSRADLKTKSERLVITKYDAIDLLEARMYLVDPSRKQGWEYRVDRSLDFHASEGDLTSYSKNISDEQLEDRIEDVHRIAEEYEATSKSKRLGQHATRKLAKVLSRKKN